METIVQRRTLSREEHIESWYLNVFPAACQFIKNRGGGLEDAKELFQEAIIIYYEKSIQESFFPEKVEEAYIMGIVKKLWLRLHSDKRVMRSLEGLEVIEEEQSINLRKNRLFSFLETAGKKCMDLLQSFYYEGLNMNEMYRRHGYGSERSVTVQKYKCLEKVRNEVKKRGLAYEDFID